MSVRDVNEDTEQAITRRMFGEVLCSIEPDASEIDPWEVSGKMYNVLDLPRRRDELQRIPRWR